MSEKPDPGTAPLDVEHRKLKACGAALFYIGRQIQENPDVRYYLGFGTQSFHLIAVAIATLTDKAVDEVEAALRADKQPSYRQREAEVIVLRDRVNKLREELGQ